jgi:hypothetical protein
MAHAPRPIRREKGMYTQVKRDEPSKPVQPSPQRGEPPTYAAHAVRKDVTVRVSVAPPQSHDTEEREDGYGHGV